MIEFLLLGITILLISIFYLFGCKNGQDRGLCEFVNCIRCNKNSRVNIKARTLLRDESFVSDRVKQAISVDFDFYVLYCQELKSKSIWKYENLPSSYQEDYQLLLKNINVFAKDYSKLLNADVEAYETGWNKLHLVNQGIGNSRNLVIASETNQVLKKVENIMDHCVFGYIFFSELLPGTLIPEHRGSTNVRLRCHVSIQIPNTKSTDCYMIVNKTRIKWLENGIIFFDDSQLHSVTYARSNQPNISRVVLLLDFWHPELTKEERRCIQNCFTPN